MLEVTLQVRAIPGTEMDIKEALALHFEPLGDVSFPKIEHKEEQMILTMQIQVPDGSSGVFHKQMRTILNRFRDTSVLEVREILPQQMEM